MSGWASKKAWRNTVAGSWGFNVEVPESERRRLTSADHNPLNHQAGKEFAVKGLRVTAQGLFLYGPNIKANGEEGLKEELLQVRQADLHTLFPSTFAAAREVARQMIADILEDANDSVIHIGRTVEL